MHIPVGIIFLVILALLFDFLNGFHDSANAIATIVSTRVLSPRVAVVYAAFFEFSAFFFFGLHVANTIGKGIVDIATVDKMTIFGALVGACGWNIITWYLGLPTSSSHALKEKISSTCPHKQKKSVNMEHCLRVSLGLAASLQAL